MLLTHNSSCHSLNESSNTNDSELEPLYSEGESGEVWLDPYYASVSIVSFNDLDLETDEDDNNDSKDSNFVEWDVMEENRVKNSAVNWDVAEAVRKSSSPSSGKSGIKIHVEDYLEFKIETPKIVMEPQSLSSSTPSVSFEVTTGELEPAAELASALEPPPEATVGTVEAAQDSDSAPLPLLSAPLLPPLLLDSAAPHIEKGVPIQMESTEKDSQLRGKSVSHAASHSPDITLEIFSVGELVAFTSFVYKKVTIPSML